MDTQLKENKILTGVIWKQILIFFFPILLGTFFQQLYNAVDAMIVGRFVGKEALAAVGGGTGTVIQLLVGFFVGLSSGATVIISQYYGAKRPEMVGYAVHTAVLFSLASGLIMMIAGIALAPAILTAMSTPEDVMDLSVLYIRIYFVGMIGNLLYNMGSGILRAVGDSKRPLYFLIISCFVNILLDVFFVAVLQMGVAGAAVATILSQAVSAGLVVAALMRTKDMHRLSLKKLCFDTRMFRRIIRIGFPAGLQSIMYSFSNIVIQASINGLGTNTAAAWTAYCKIDCMNWMTINAFGIAITTFVGQNYGAGREDRARRGMVTCLGMSYGSTILISILLYTFGGYVVRLFSTDPEVLEISKSILRFLVPIYFTYTAVEILSGTLRGVGDTWVPMILCCVGICLIRLVWIWTVVPYHQNIYAITVSYPITWTVTSIMFIIYYRYFSRMKKVKLTA